MKYKTAYLFPLPVILLSLLVGSTSHISYLDYLSLWWSSKFSDITQAEQVRLDLIHSILFQVRLPRILLTFISGTVLAASGTVLQGIYRNPLVDSYILGISSGAAVGAALAISVWFIPVGIPAFIGGLVAVYLTYSIASKKRSSTIVSIVLSGMVISGMFTAIMAIIQYVSNPYKLQAIVQWTMGNLNAATWEDIHQVMFPVLISLIIVYVWRWKLNVLAMGDEAAQAIGLNPKGNRVILVFAATLMTSAIVSVVGIISFYGLLIPHITRLLWGADNKKIVPASMAIGGTGLVLIDNLSRVFFTFEIPIGIFTVLLGGGFFVYLMRKKDLHWH